MLNNRIECKWIDCFERVFALCKIARGDLVAILSETQSRRINVQLAELALLRMGARAFHVVVPTPRLETCTTFQATPKLTRTDENMNGKSEGNTIWMKSRQRLAPKLTAISTVAVELRLMQAGVALALAVVGLQGRTNFGGTLNA